MYTDSGCAGLRGFFLLGFFACAWPLPTSPASALAFVFFQEGVEPFFLDTQFRAHPKLMEWVAGSIYENRLRSGIPDSARPAVEGFEWPRKKAEAAAFLVWEVWGMAVLGCHLNFMRLL